MNVNGGAIALGRPMGATGAKLTKCRSSMSCGRRSRRGIGRSRSAWAAAWAPRAFWSVST